MRPRASRRSVCAVLPQVLATRLGTRGLRYNSYEPLPGRDPSGVGRGSLGNPWGIGLASPRQLVHYLDSFVVGQERAKKILAVAVFNHYNRVRANVHAHEDAAAASEWSEGAPIVELEVEADGPSRASIQPHPYRRFSSSHIPPVNTPPIFEKSNVLMLGPTGSGKTLLAKTLARVLDVPFAVSDATSLTQAGYVGEDVESVIQRLLQAANWDTRRASFGIICIDECDKLARRGVSAGGDGGRDVGGEGVQQALLRMLEGTVVNVKGGGLDGGVGAGPPNSGSGSPGFDLPPSGVASSSTTASNTPGRKRGGPSVSGSSLGQPQKSDSYQVDTTDILFILSGAFVGLDKIIRTRVAKGSIGFNAPLVAKNDKSLLKRLSGSPTTSTPSSAGFMPFFTPNGKDMDVLDLVEPADLASFGFIPEFISRLPTTAVLHQLSPDDLLRVLTEVRGALAKQYEALFAYSGVEIRFTTLALREICSIALKRGGGARGLRGIMESLLLEPMYDCPGSSVRYVLIDQAVVLGEKPAHYWSRSEGASFYGMLAAEEEKWEMERAAKSSDIVPEGGILVENTESRVTPEKRVASAAS